ncbi:hypothetical protein GH714_008240 [Hevea brasiliensis]|uniref:Uncharacterized protein n=1 Tax=Hevea brasiliensis TaxID=3981 RepID=A0A6A6N1N7_HEVBR|nr:hypothetical protein GH714_008240 [Hevea brasiliensis]
MVAKLSKGEGEPIELKATQNLRGIVDDIKDDVKKTVNIIECELYELKEKVNLLVRAASNPIMGSYKVGKTKIPEPKAFSGARDARKVDNFLFEMELYFNAIKNDSDESRLKIVPMYLVDDAKLRNMKELNATLAIAESLNDYSNDASKIKFGSPPSLDNCPSKGGKPSSGGVNKSYLSFGGTIRKGWSFEISVDRSTNLGKEKNNVGSWDNRYFGTNNVVMAKPKILKCYLYDGPHRVADCPHKGALNVLQAIQEKEKGLKVKEQRKEDSAPFKVKE